MKIPTFIAAMTESPAEADKTRPYSDIVARIGKLNDDLSEFWSSAHGWAPDSAAALISKSRLDWQVSLSRSLHHWGHEEPDTLEDGDLILGWANLGSLIEGTLKLFLAVHYETYKNDLENLEKTEAWHVKKGQAIDPDILKLQALIQYSAKAKIFTDEQLALFKLVQERRNAIHAFKDRPIGTGSELHKAIRDYLGFLRLTAARLPYPDNVYEPREV